MRIKAAKRGLAVSPLLESRTVPPLARGSMSGLGRGPNPVLRDREIDLSPTRFDRPRERRLGL
jgi:hypothetical protein